MVPLLPYSKCLYLFSLKGGGVLEVKGSVEEVDRFFLLLSSCFSSVSCSYGNVNFIDINALQINTQSLRDCIGGLIKLYDRQWQLRRLLSFLKKLDDRECFFVLPFARLNSEQVIRLSNFLRVCNFSELSFKQIQGDFDELFGCVLEHFDVFVVYPPFEEKGKIYLGERDKSKRRCRFCERSQKEGALFKKDAHAISEALGNKSFILCEECDKCNEYFGETIERDLISFLNPFRVVFSTKTKGGGVPKIKIKNFQMFRDGKTIILKVFDSFINRDGNTFEISSPKIGRIRLQNIYKSLCKFAISVIDTKQVTLDSFKETIKWIRNNNFYDTLPLVYVANSYSLFTSHPYIVVYLRKNKEKRFPYAIGEFHFMSLIFVFIVPTFLEEEKENELNREWFSSVCNCFRYYNSLKWSPLDLSDSSCRDFSYKFKFVSRS